MEVKLVEGMYLTEDIVSGATREWMQYERSEIEHE